MIKLILAINDNLAIGKNGKLMYRLKDDMKNFKKMTSGCTVVMGRKTFESLPNGELPDRLNVVITSQPENVVTKENSNVTFITPENFLAYFLPHHSTTEESVWIIGGAQVYETATPFANEIICTFVDDEEEGDVYLSEGLFGGFVQGGVLQTVDVDEDNDKGYSIVQLINREHFFNATSEKIDFKTTGLHGDREVIPTAVSLDAEGIPLTPVNEVFADIGEPFKLAEELTELNTQFSSLTEGGLKQGEAFILGARTSQDKSQVKGDKQD